MTLLFQTVLEPSPQCAALARDAVHEELARIGMTHLVDDACLLTSELVTNAVRHAGTTLALCVDWDGLCVRVEVEDRTQAPPLPGTRPRTEPGGLGLAIVAAVASRWGFEAAHGDGKVVWFELDAHDPKRAEPVKA